MRKINNNNLNGFITSQRTTNNANYITPFNSMFLKTFIINIFLVTFLCKKKYFLNIAKNIFIKIYTALLGSRKYGDHTRRKKQDSPLVIEKKSWKSFNWPQGHCCFPVPGCAPSSKVAYIVRSPENSHKIYACTVENIKIPLHQMTSYLINRLSRTIH